MIEMVGLVGSVLLAICALPLTIEAIARGRVDIQTTFLALWFGGEICMLVYAISLRDGILIFNYSANCALLLPVVAVKRRNK